MGSIRSPIGRALARVFSCLALCAGLAACADPAPPTYEAQVINPDLVGGLTLPDSTVLLWGSDATILRSLDGANWSHAMTPGDADLARVASNSDGSEMIAVGARGVVLRSVDGGKTWTAANNAEPADLRTVTFHAPGKAWIAAGAGGRILRSADGGQNWASLPSPLTTDLQATFVDPKTRNLLLGGEEGVIGISTDGGTSWNITKIAMPDPVTPVTAFHRFGDLLLAPSAMGRFLVSVDDGESWDLLQADSKAYWTAAARDPARDAIVLVGHNGEVLRSADRGRNWQLSAIEVDGRRNYLAGVYYDERSRSLLAVGDGGTIVQSVDGGANWEVASRDVRESLRGLAVMANRIIAFGPGGLVVSTKDSGAHWTHDRHALEMQLREITATPSGSLLAGSTLGDLIRSEDGGRAWSPRPVTYPNVNTPPDLRVLMPAPAGDAMIAAGPPGAILRSDMRGETWQVVHWSEIEEERAFPWMLADRERNLLVAVEARGRLQVSRDGGLGWSAVQLDAPAGSFVFWQGTVHAPSGTLLIAGKGGLAARSTDGARTWSRVETGTDKDLYGSFADDSLMFLAGQDGTLLRSTDLGLTWNKVVSGSSNELRRMLRDRESGALICYGAHGAIVRSGDDGLTWQAVASGSDGVLRKALVEPGTDNLLLVGGQGTLRRSTDGGQSWQPLPTHSSRHFTSAALVPGSGDLVLVGERIVRLVRRSR